MKEEFWILVGGLILVVMLALSIAFVSAHFEAKMYNRITGQDVSTWEAAWVELRVDCN